MFIEHLNEKSQRRLERNAPHFAQVEENKMEWAGSIHISPLRGFGNYFFSPAAAAFFCSGGTSAAGSSRT
jgi:hypothetical protein